LAHDVGGGAVPLFKCVRVHTQRDGRIRVPQSPSNSAHVDAGTNQLGCREVTQIVQTDVVQPKRVTDPG